MLDYIKEMFELFTRQFISQGNDEEIQNHYSKLQNQADRGLLDEQLMRITPHTDLADLFEEFYNIHPVKEEESEPRKRDIEPDYELERKAAEQGNASAQFNLGVMYDEGLGVKKDYIETVKWYRKAAEQGHAEAQCYLGTMYQNGEGLPVDFGEAVKWFRKAAEKGDAVAQFLLAGMYFRGNGTLKDLSKAKYWTEKVYENPKAPARTKELAEKNWNKLELWKY